MIIGLGIDSIEIERFSHWHRFSNVMLRRIFSEKEIVYCLQNETTAAERFAARFAAREAFFKAIQTAYPTTHIPFLSICRIISLSNAQNGSPTLLIEWDMLRKLTNNEISTPLSALVSITHTRTTATACVFLQA
ncbi:4'-phosphopantetheinyl transferase superfamily protein [Candidatus Dependentiae bacterium]|nr:MAG: 4'-phosphopantetheinyl transferase superfamily protein [Candidatus Dependentiae bacterium]